MITCCVAKVPLLCFREIRKFLFPNRALIVDINKSVYIYFFWRLSSRSRDKTDHDVIRENHRFLWDEEDSPDTWEAQLAKKYYDKLFKEYCICDLTMYKSNKVRLKFHWKLFIKL